MNRTIALIRHGATHLNSSKSDSSRSGERIRGWLNVPLTDAGMEEAKKLGGKIAKMPESSKPEILVSSDLARAWQTASIISKISGIPLAPPTPALRPWDLGDFAGCESKIVGPKISNYATEKPDKPVPNGESFHQFEHRFLSGLGAILNAIPDKVGLVSHHRNERLLDAWKAAGYPPDGHIDHDVFGRHGVDTASIQNIQIPMDRLRGHLR